MSPDTIALVSAAVAAGATPEQLAAIVSAAQGTSEGTGVNVEAAPTKQAPTKRKPVSKRTSGKSKSTDAADKVYTWHSGVCNRYGIPAKVGETFEYLSKRSGTKNTHRVVAVASDGTVNSVRA